jgi:hypothetical protein
MSYYNVAPRYTCGSPAIVRHELALRVAEEEREAYERVLSGSYGQEQQESAERSGLGSVDGRSIAERVTEHSNHWMIEDLLTGEIYARPFRSLGLVRGNSCKRCQAAKEKQRLVKV